MGQRHIGLLLVGLFITLMVMDPRPVWLLAMILSGFATGWSYGHVLVDVEG